MVEKVNLRCLQHKTANTFLMPQNIFCNVGVLIKQQLNIKGPAMDHWGMGYKHFGRLFLSPHSLLRMIVKQILAKSFGLTAFSSYLKLLPKLCSFDMASVDKLPCESHTLLQSHVQNPTHRYVVSIHALSSWDFIQKLFTYYFSEFDATLSCDCLEIICYVIWHHIYSYVLSFEQERIFYIQI